MTVRTRGMDAASKRREFAAHEVQEPGTVQESVQDGTLETELLEGFNNLALRKRNQTGSPQSKKATQARARNGANRNGTNRKSQDRNSSAKNGSTPMDVDKNESHHGEDDLIAAPDSSETYLSWQYGPLALFEKWLRLMLQKFAVLIVSNAMMLRLMNVFYVYVCLQCVGLMWAFLVNVLSNVGLKMGNIFFQVEEQVGLIEGAAFVVQCYCVLRLVVLLSIDFFQMAFQTVDDLPTLRVMISQDRSSRAVMFGVLMGPLLLMTSVAVSAPYMCEHPEVDIFEFCSRGSLMSLFNEPYKMPLRVLRICLTIAIYQWLCVLLYQVPSFNKGFPGKTRWRWYALNVLSIPLILATIAWFSLWGISHLGVNPEQYTGLEHGRASLLLMLGWLVFWSLFVVMTPPSAKTYYGQPEKLVPMILGVRVVFFVFPLFQFARSAMHPNIGFMDAQDEFTLVCVIMPLMYLTIISVSKVFMILRNWTQTFQALAISIALALALMYVSKLPGYVNFILLVLYFMRRYILNTVPRSEAAAIVTAGDGVRGRRHSRHAKTGKALVGATFRFLFNFMAFFCIVLALVNAASYLQTSTKLTLMRTLDLGIDDGDNSLVFKHAELHETRLTLKEPTEIQPRKDWMQRKDLPQPYYLSCESSFYNFTLTDLMIMSEVAYVPENDRVYQKLLEKAFPKESFGRISAHIHKGEHRSGQHLEVEFVDREIIVVAVRGTDPLVLNDVVEDIRMWTEPVALNILSAIFPTIRWWPDRTSAMMVNLMHESLEVFHAVDRRHMYYQQVIQRVDEIRRSRPHIHVVLTGHSLGGGVARAVGLVTDTTSIAFSAPGIKHAYSKFRHPDRPYEHVEAHQVYHRTMNVVSEYDPISGLIDMQSSGLVQYAQCASATDAYAFACHIPGTMLCELVNQCDGVHNRFKSCDAQLTLGRQVTDITQKLAILIKDSFGTELWPLLLVLSALPVLLMLRFDLW
eukprot:Clim_evm42s201 gene=Clim_evmTU42s201